MGRRGPAPKPTEMLKLSGSWRANLNRNEPKPEPGMPECPSYLDEDAKKTWDVLIPMLHTMRVLTHADIFHVGRFCLIHSRWVKMELFLQKAGATYVEKSDDGNVKSVVAFPQVAIAAKLATILTRMEQGFGLTPSARTRINTEASAGALRPAMTPVDRARAAFFESPSPWAPPKPKKPRKKRAPVPPSDPPATAAAG